MADEESIDLEGEYRREYVKHVKGGHDADYDYLDLLTVLLGGKRVQEIRGEADETAGALLPGHKKELSRN